MAWGHVLPFQLRYQFLPILRKHRGRQGKAGAGHRTNLKYKVGFRCTAEIREGRGLGTCIAFSTSVSKRHVHCIFWFGLKRIVQKKRKTSRFRSQLRLLIRLVDPPVSPVSITMDAIGDATP